MSKSVDRHPHICLVLCALFVLSSPAAETQPRPGLRRRTASRAVHRGVEMAAAGDRAQRSVRRRRRERPVSQGRSGIATGATRVLDADAGGPGRDPVRPALGRGESERASLPCVHSRARQRREVPDLRSAVQQRHLLLDRVHAASGLRDGRRVPSLSGASPRRAALLRRADRQHAGRPGARLHRAARVGRRPRQDDRAVREGRHDQPVVRALHADALDHRRERPGRAPRGSGDGDPGRRRTGVRQAAHDDARRISPQGTDDACGGRDAGRRGLLPGDDREVHDAEPDGQADP